MEDTPHLGWNKTISRHRDISEKALWRL
jgi:hypothetical protein